MTCSHLIKSINKYLPPFGDEFKLHSRPITDFSSQVMIHPPFLMIIIIIKANWKSSLRRNVTHLAHKHTCIDYYYAQEWGWQFECIPWNHFSLSSDIERGKFYSIFYTHSLSWECLTGALLRGEYSGACHIYYSTLLSKHVFKSASATSPETYFITTTTTTTEDKRTRTCALIP